MPLYIRDDTVKDLAERVAAARRTTLTEAVRRALEQALADVERERKAKDAALDALLREFDSHPGDRPYGDADLYDEDGIPR